MCTCYFQCHLPTGNQASHSGFLGFDLAENLNFTTLCGKKSGVEKHCLNIMVTVLSDFEYKPCSNCQGAKFSPTISYFHLIFHYKKR